MEEGLALVAAEMPRAAERMVRESFMVVCGATKGR